MPNFVQPVEVDSISSRYEYKLIETDDRGRSLWNKKTKQQFEILYLGICKAMQSRLSEGSIVVGRSKSRPGTIVKTLERSTSDGQWSDGRVRWRKRLILLIRLPAALRLLQLENLCCCCCCCIWRRSCSCSCWRRNLCSRKKKTFDILMIFSTIPLGSRLI